MLLTDDRCVQKHNQRPQGVTFAFSGRSKCGSWEHLLVFQEKYLSSMNGICFFRDKANVTTGGGSASVSAHILASVSGICFFGKTKCSSLLGCMNSYLSSES